MGNRRTYLTNQIVKYSNWLHDKGFVANHDGNVSARFEDGLLSTPTAVSKGDIIPEIVITLDMEGKKVAGVGKSFSEIKLHLAAYRIRADAQAVVHAHPPFATAHGMVGQALKPQLPEAIVSIGDCIPVMPFAMPGTPESLQAVERGVTVSDILILPGNGVLAIGDNVEQAYLRLELVEHMAKIQYYANTMGSPTGLSDAQVAKLLDKRASIGLGPQNRGISSDVFSAETMSPPVPVLPTLDRDQLKSLIATEIKNILQS